MELLYTHLADRKRLAQAEFVARMGVGVMVFKPGDLETTESMSTGSVVRVAGLSWQEVKALIRDDAKLYRVVRLEPFTGGGERVVSIGRSSGNEVILNYQGVSKQHAALHIRPDGVFIIDLGSRNGTTLDNGVVGTEPVRVSPPSTITLGHIELRCMDPKSYFAFLGELML